MCDFFKILLYFIISLCLVLSVWLVCALACFSLGLYSMGLFVPLGLDWLFPFHVGEIFNYNLFKNFLIPFLFFRDSYNSNVGVFDLVQRSLRLSSVLFILFTLFCSPEVISTILSSSSLICSASDILLLTPSRVFLISEIVFFMFILEFF